MFEQRGWAPEGLVHGPVPLSPTSLVPTDLLAWARRAPLNGAWLDAVLGIDEGALDPGDRVELAVVWDRLRRGIDGRFTSVLGSIPVQRCAPDPHDPSCDGGSACSHDWSAMEVKNALTIGPQHAQHLLEEARELVERLPGMLGEVVRGDASLLHARRLAGRTIGIGDRRVVRLVEHALLGKAAMRTAAAFDVIAQRAISRLRTSTEVLEDFRRSDRALTGIRPLPTRDDGIGRVEIVGPAARIAELFGWCRTFTRANRHPDDDRTVGQRRFDALVDALSCGTGTATSAAAAPESSQPAVRGSSVPAAPGSGLPGRVGAPPRVALRLVMSAITIAGLDDEPGWLSGHGYLPAALGRQLAVNPETIQRLLTHPQTSELLDLSPELRTPAVGLARFVRARDGICSSPGCGALGEHTEIDHIVEYQDGGKTVRVNLHCVCKQHHRARHTGGWRIVRHPDGSETWTSPHGRSYRTEPSRHLAPSAVAVASDDAVDELEWSAEVEARPGEGVVGSPRPGAGGYGTHANGRKVETGWGPGTSRGSDTDRGPDRGDDDCPF